MWRPLHNPATLSHRALPPTEDPLTDNISLPPEHVRLHFSSRLANLELDNLGHRRTEYVSSSFTRDHLFPEHETVPLVYQDPGPSFNDHIARRGTPS